MVRGAKRPNSQPTAAAAATTTGNGTAKTANARKAATAIPTRAGCVSARFPTRITACATIASTAGATPANSAATAVVVAERHVHRRQGEQRDNAGEDEQDARGQAAAGAVQQPAGVDGQLLRLRAGQQHAVVQRVQKPLLTDPALLVHQGLLHDRDLAGRAAEGLQRDEKPGAHGLAERHQVPCRPRWRARCGQRGRRAVTFHHVTPDGSRAGPLRDRVRVRRARRAPRAPPRASGPGSGTPARNAAGCRPAAPQVG